MMRTTTISRCLLVVLLLTPIALPQTQESPTKCQPDAAANLKAPPYKTGRVAHSAPNYPPELGIYINIEPKYFVCADMIALARQLDKDYNGESRFVVIILDDYDALIHTSPIHNTRDFLAARRGYYRKDRTTGEESLRFSTQRGKPVDEVKINLGKTAI